MKTIYTTVNKALFYAFIVAFLFGVKTIIANQSNYQGSQNQRLDPENYLPGVITIKVKESIGPFESQRSNVSFGISSLDNLAQQNSVTTLVKRFMHKPVPQHSELPDLSRIYKIEFPEDRNVWEIAAAFEADPNIEYAEPVPLNSATLFPDDPLYNLQQHLPQIMAAEAWDIHKGEDGSSEVVIAIIDTGVDWLHPDLTENTWQNSGEDADGDGVTIEFNNGSWELDPDDLNGIDDDGNGYADDLIGWDFWEASYGDPGSNPDPFPHSDAHGTHCAGIAAGRTNNGIGISSISFNLKYMPTKVDDGFNHFYYPYEAILYAADHGADIINISWGSPAYSEANKEVIAYAVAMGSIVVSAAANENSSQEYYPAAYPGTIAVAALNTNDTKAWFSNYGMWTDISAPGVDIFSTTLNDGYETMNGTSMAAPMVSGLIGLLKSYNPEWTNDQLLNQVIGTADDIDSHNPEFENLLGDGRINAYNAMANENALPKQQLKLEFTSYSVHDENEDGMIEPEETASIDLQLKNWSQLVSSDEVSFTLSTYSPDISITSGSVTTSVPADGEFEIANAFEFTVNEDASTQEVTFIITVSADIEVMTGEDFLLKVLVAPSGVFVWDGQMDQQGYSGSYISEYLEEHDYNVLYSNVYPSSFAGFDAVFLSFGNAGQNSDQAVLFAERHGSPISDYLQDGGNLYIEGMAIMSIPYYFGWENPDEFIDLFGVVSSYTSLTPNPITSLVGQDETIGQGMLYSESNQTLNWYIDNIEPDTDAQVPFYEDNFGPVSVYNEGAYGQKTFYLGYCLADLVDADPFSSKYHLLARIMDFINSSTDDDYVVANFDPNMAETLPGQSVLFSDLSVSAEGYTINSWAWDFNEDGIIDSDQESPVWIYDTGGNYDVMLVVSNGQTVDTLIRKNVVLVRSGIFVYEGEENGIDQSGAFIRDYLQDNGYEVAYANHFPSELSGFDAVFASFGSSPYTGTVLNNEIADALLSYAYMGGNIYLEGANALGSDQAENDLLWFVFGLENVENGPGNMPDQLSGQEGSIMQGMEFSASTQFTYNNIDLYNEIPLENAARVAFQEGDYGPVAVQFDGSGFFGHRTFCMSYSLANLIDGSYPNTRDEILNHILEFFNPTTDTREQETISENSIKVYPNPARGAVSLSFVMEVKSPVKVEVYTLGGSKVLTEAERYYTAGRNEIRLGTDILNAGTYFYKVISSNQTYTGKILIIK